MTYLFFLFLILLIIISFSIIYLSKYGSSLKTIENFEDLIEQNESYQEIYDKEFVDFYEIIYRDYSDIDHDLKLVSSKIFNSNNNPNLEIKDINILVAGSGVGKLCNKFIY